MSDGYAELSSLYAPYTFPALTGANGLQAFSLLKHGKQYLTQGYSAAGDTGHGLYRYDRDSTATPDGGSVLLPESGQGRLLLIHQGNLNITQYGAKRDGSADCANLVRAAHTVGNVHYPAGTYLHSTVNPRSGRRYTGDGMGRTILKKHNGHTSGSAWRQLFAITTVDTLDPSDPEVYGEIKNVVIERFTADFNFTSGWVNFAPPIGFRADNTLSHRIRGVTIREIEFIDSSEVVNSEVAGTSAVDQDAWCINLEAAVLDGPGIVDLTIRDCISRAEGHQFISGGGSGIEDARILNNTAYYPHANGITCTTVSESVDKPVRMRNILYQGNLIYGASGRAFMVGRDPAGGSVRGACPLYLEDIHFYDNQIVFAQPQAYGTVNPGPTDASAFLISPGDFAMKNVVVERNTLRVETEGFLNGSCNFFRLETYNYNRSNPGADPPIPDPTTTADYTQPGVGSTVEVTVSTATQGSSKAIFTVGAVVAIYGGGYYEIMAVNGLVVTLRLLDWPSVPNLTTGQAYYAQPSTNEVVDIRNVDTTGGTFTITHSGNTTSSLDWNASASTVQSALEGLASIGSGNVAVTSNTAGHWVITFQGALAATNISALTTNSASLTGPGTPEAVVVTLVNGGTGATISSGAVVKFRGGRHQRLSVSNNNLLPDFDAGVYVVGAWLENSTFANNKGALRLEFTSSNILGTNVQGNQNCLMRVTSSNWVGAFHGNRISPGPSSSTGRIRWSLDADSRTGFPHVARGPVMNNYLLETGYVPLTDRAFGVIGAYAYGNNQQLVLMNNYFPHTSSGGLAENPDGTGRILLSGPSNIYSGFGGGGPDPYNWPRNTRQFTLAFDLSGVPDTQSHTVSFPGATTSNLVELAVPNNILGTTDQVRWTAWVSGTDQVTIRARRDAGSTPVPGTGTFRVTLKGRF